MLQSGACRLATPGGGSVRQVTSACQQLNAHCVLLLRHAALASLTISKQLEGKVVELSLVPPTFGKDFAEPSHHTTYSVVRHSRCRLACNVDTDQTRDSRANAVISATCDMPGENRRCCENTTGCPLCAQRPAWSLLLVCAVLLDPSAGIYSVPSPNAADCRAKVWIIKLEKKKGLAGLSEAYNDIACYEATWVYAMSSHCHAGVLQEHAEFAVTTHVFVCAALSHAIIIM